LKPTESPERIIEITGDLPTMPSLAAVILEKTADPNLSAQQFQQIISQDQSLVARILRTANSPLYGCSRTVQRITDAILVLGYSAIRSLIVTSAVHGLFKRFGLQEKLLWVHALGCAFLSRRIGQITKGLDPEQAFLAGLLHDVGKVVLSVKFPDQTLDIFQRVYNNAGSTFLPLEEQSFGFNHAQVGQLIARKWRFPMPTEEAIAFHHQPEYAKAAPNLCWTVSVANTVCHKLAIGPTKNPSLDLFQIEGVQRLQIEHSLLEKLIAEVTADLASKEDLFAG
jgi:putative nucleotidyltransferase with HDIG domain